MENRSSRHIRTLVIQMAVRGLSANQIAYALISMMARSTAFQAEAGYIDARPHLLDRRNLLAPHGRTIQLGHFRRIHQGLSAGGCPLLPVSAERGPSQKRCVWPDSRDSNSQIGDSNHALRTRRL